MKLPVSNKTSSYGKKPHIRKGYFPGQLLSVKPYKDRSGQLKESKYGHQLIFLFAVYKSDPQTGKPLELMRYETKEGEIKSVILPLFADYEWKDAKTGEYVTAVTPNSRITKIFKALGWEFDVSGIDPEDFLYKWIELNIDDYETEYNSEKYTASSIKDTNPYKGPQPDPRLEKAELPNEPQQVKKQLNNGNVKKAETIEDKKTKLKNLLDEGLLTQDGYNQAIEQLNAIKEEPIQ